MYKIPIVKFTLTNNHGRDIPYSMMKSYRDFNKMNYGIYQIKGNYFEFQVKYTLEKYSKNSSDLKLDPKSLELDFTDYFSIPKSQLNNYQLKFKDDKVYTFFKFCNGDNHINFPIYTKMLF
jgi:hypothetical protein